jgi:hypothetical protein
MMVLPASIGMIRPASSGGGAWVTTANLGTISSTSSGWNGYTLRQIIPASAMAAGSRVRVQLYNAGTAGTQAVISKAYFGKQAASGDPYDFDTTPEQMFFGGNPGTTILPAMPQYTDGLVTPITADAYVLAVYFSNSGASAVAHFTTGATGFADYYKIGDDATTVNASGYTLGANNRSLLLGRVEVWQP